MEILRVWTRALSRCFLNQTEEFIDVSATSDERDGTRNGSTDQGLICSNQEDSMICCGEGTELKIEKADLPDAHHLYSSTEDETLSSDQCFLS